MTNFLARSRITKALTDGGLAPSFPEAERRLNSVRPAVLLGSEMALTPAGQFAALTAIATMRKCFGNATLIVEHADAALLRPLLVGDTIGKAARAYGASIAATVPGDITHLVRIGDDRPWQGWQLSVWWDRWLTGTRRESEPFGSSSLALSGIFAGALAVRQIFAALLAAMPPREVTVSLWEPMRAADLDRPGPRRITLPSHLWLVGLGHLGQAYVWNLLSLPLAGERKVILQDDQWIETENEATSLLATKKLAGARPKKARLAAQWLDNAGWETQLIERRHAGDIKRTATDPPILITGLDDVRPRQILAAQGFDYMIDAGIGRGPRDFEGLQIRAIPAGADIQNLWLEAGSDEVARRDRLLERDAYAALASDIGPCGVVPFADAGVSVPFVGAATGALVIAQLARLGAMQSAPALLQMELGSPEMILDGGVVAAPESFLGGETVALD